MCTEGTRQSVKKISAYKEWEITKERRREGIRNEL